MMAFTYWKLFRGTQFRDVDRRPMVFLVKGDGDVISYVVRINRAGQSRAFHNHSCQLLPGVSPHTTQIAVAT